jgi:F0F1-type ATP synthase delta subunit
MEYSKVTEQISTVFEVVQLQEAAAALSSALYKTTDGVFEETFREKMPIHLAEVLRSILPADREARAAYLRGLTELLQTLPIVTAHLAFHPTEAFLAELVGKLREATGEQTVVEVRVSRLLLGGARLEYRGRFKDYSVRQQLSAVLDQEQERIGSMSET